jgi:excisionase family DNA binding protein
LKQKLHRKKQFLSLRGNYNMNTVVLTTNQLCKTLSISRPTVLKLVRHGMPVITIGRNKRFDLEEVMTFLKERSGLFETKTAS